MITTLGVGLAIAAPEGKPGGDVAESRNVDPPLLENRIRTSGVALV